MFVLPFAHTTLRPSRPALRRVDSAASLAQAIDRLFDGVQVPTPAAAVRTPALDVDETNTHYLLSFDLPGASKSALKVSIEGRRVRIETQAPQAPATANADTTPTEAPAAADTTQATPEAAPADSPRSLYRERSNVLFARTVSLPQEVDSDASEAKLENGVLTLRLAKRRADGARHLPIN